MRNDYRERWRYEFERTYPITYKSVIHKIGYIMMTILFKNMKVCAMDASGTPYKMYYTANRRKGMTDYARDNIKYPTATTIFSRDDNVMGVLKFQWGQENLTENEAKAFIKFLQMIHIRQSSPVTRAKRKVSI